MEPKRTLLIVDDHPLFREGLKVIIGRDARFQVVGEAGTARDGLRMARDLKPDLMLVDISLPDQSGIELTRQARDLLPETHILIVSMHSRIDYIGEAFRAGALGYMTKGSVSEMLMQGLDSVSTGEHFLDSSVSHQVVKRLMVSPAGDERITDASYGTLTRREQEVMRLLAEGLSSKNVAERLCLSPKTVENHRASIMGKLGLHSSHELTRYAARLGLIDVDLWKE